MAEAAEYGDVRVEVGDDYVATAEIRRPPNNFIDVELIDSLSLAFETLDADPNCRAIVLCSQGKHFCAGADFSRSDRGTSTAAGGRHLYDAALRLVETKTPVVAAVQGAAVGGGLGLALVPDFRVAAPEARFSANFARLAFHHGFGLSVTLPALVGQQAAMNLLYTGRRVAGEEAFAMGLCDALVPMDQLRDRAHALAADIAESAPLAIRSIRDTLRGDLPARFRAATNHERAQQERLQGMADFKEGIAAMAERRTPKFTGRQT